MGPKASESIFWTTTNPDSATVIYDNETVVVEPETILERVMDMDDSVQELSSNGSKESSGGRATTKVRLTDIVREQRRKFWHLRRQTKQFLRRLVVSSRTGSTHSKEIATHRGTQPTRGEIDTARLFDPKVAQEKMQDEIHALYESVDNDYPSEFAFLLAQKLYKAGSVSRAAAVVQKYEEFFANGSLPDPSLVGKIFDDLELLESSPQIPERGNGPIIAPEGGRMLYCAASTTHYNSNGYATRTSGLISGLKNNGYDVVVAARPGYPWDAKIDRTVPKTRFHAKFLNGVEYAYSYGPSLKSQSLLNYLQSAVDSYLRLIERYRPSHVHAASNHATALPALIAARLAGVGFTYEVRGFWEYAQSELFSEPNERRLLATKLEDLVLANADHVYILSREMKQELIKRGYRSKDISILPNGVDTDLFQPLPKTGDLVKKYQLDDGKINIGYAGSMVAYEGLDVVTDALLDLSRERDDFRLVLVGDGPVLPAIRQKIEESELDICVEFLGRVAHSHMPSLIASFDITVAARKETEVTRVVSPLKPLEAMAAGVPFVASDLPVLRTLVSESQGGVLFQTENKNDLKDKLVDLLDNPERIKRLGRVGRSWVIQNRHWDKLASGLGQRLEKPLTYARPSDLSLSDIKMGVIADEFTTASFGDAVQLVKIDRFNWKQQLIAQPIDILFVESAWKGNGGQWIRGIGHYSDEESADLRVLIDWCQRNRVPTVFWNKEDPVHFQRFRENALLFDLVLTTDNRSIPNYQTDRRWPSQQFGSMPFFGTPKLHHPVASSVNVDCPVLYAGSYYGARYPERSDNLTVLLQAARTVGLTIYDRQADIEDSPYQFPEELRSYVSGGLDYPEMVKAYREFPVHLNVNSVVESETMFSRRVVEIGLTGGMVLSSPSSAIDFLFAGLVPGVNQFHAARDLLRVLLAEPDIRNIQGWNLRRVVRRSHTVYTRLSAILRRVGINVQGLRTREVQVRIKDATTTENIRSLLNQTVPPTSVVVPDWVASNSEAMPLFHESNTRVFVEADQSAPVPKEYTFDWNGQYLDSSVVEDLICVAEDVAAPQVILDTQRPADAFRPLARFSDTDDSSGLSVLAAWNPTRTSGRNVTITRGIVVETNSLTSGFVDTPDSSRRPISLTDLSAYTILVAGHDLKFANSIIHELRSRGAQVLIDKWDSHNSHDRETSLSLLSQAHIVFCEWGLGNAVWYSYHVQPEQRLILRVHSQELFRNYLNRINTQTVDKIIFVAPHIRDAAANISRIRNLPSVVVPNLVLPPRRMANRSVDRFSMGLVGIVPQQKGMHKALDLLQALRLRDSRFTLRIKGKLPHEYPWLQSREDEMQYYNTQFERVKQDHQLRDAVFFDGFSADLSEMESWYSSIGVALSLSDFESFHYTLVDGALSWALPVALRWPGSDRLYPESWLNNDIEEMAEYIYRVVSDEQLWERKTHEAQKFVEYHYDYSATLGKFLRALME